MINDDSHNLMLGLANKVDSLLKEKCNIWINDLGYMKVVDPDSDVICKVWLDNGNLMFQIEGGWMPKELDNDPISLGKVSVFEDSDLNPNMAKTIARHTLQAMHSVYHKEETRRILPRRRSDEANTQQLFKEVISALKKGLKPAGIDVDGYTFKDITFSERGNPDNKLVCPWSSDNTGTLKIQCGPTKTTFGVHDRRGVTKNVDTEHQVQYMIPILRRMMGMDKLTLRPDAPVKEERKRVLPRRIKFI